MSIASSRRGRPNNRRDADADLAPNTIRVAGQFRCEIYASLGELPSGVFEILVDCLSSPDVGEFIELDDTLSIPDDTTVERGPIPVFKYQLFKNRTAMLGDGYVVLDDDAPVLDLNRARVATESEIREALDYEPEPIKPPAPVAPSYRRIPRQLDDNTSYLGFSVAPSEQLPVKLAKNWTCVAFNLPVAQIVGRIAVTLNFRSLESDKLAVRVFDADGKCHLSTEMSQSHVEFDQTRIPAGDTLLVYRCMSGALMGEGSYRHPNARVVASLPERPAIDRLLSEPEADIAPNVQCGVPRFEFSAR